MLAILICPTYLIIALVLIHFLNYVCNPDRKSGSSQADLVNFLKFMIVAEHGVQVEFNVILAIWVKWLNKLLLSHSAEVSQASIILQIFFQVSP